MKCIKCDKKIVSLENIREISEGSANTIRIVYKDCQIPTIISGVDIKTTMNEIYEILREKT